MKYLGQNLTIFSDSYLLMHIAYPIPYLLNKEWVLDNTLCTTYLTVEIMKYSNWNCWTHRYFELIQ